MNKLSSEKRAQVITALVEGNSINSTCRITGVAQMTVLKLIADVGAACSELQDRWFRGITAPRVQIDEIWSFVGMKAKNVPDELRGTFGVGEPLRIDVVEHELAHVDAFPLAREPRNELRRIRRAAADDGDLGHPFTPVRVTPSTNAFCARKKMMITGAITMSVAAMVRFHCT